MPVVPFVYPTLQTHAAADVLPFLRVVANGPHDVHAVAPDAVEYVFAGHGVKKLLPASPKYPALAVHAVTVVLPAGEFEFGAQDVHTASALAASVVEYLPAAHLSHP